MVNKNKVDEMLKTIESCATLDDLLAIEAECERDFTAVERNRLNSKLKAQEAIIRKTEKRSGNARQFISTYTPKMIEQKLNSRVIGQKQLTAAVADFLYYHNLRQLHPELPIRPMLIAGPSGSGKTEVWRVASKLFGDTCKITIVDGSRITGEGWKGDYKIANFITEDFAAGGILIVDEFDKLARPSQHSNSSLEFQSEFLKLVEGEYTAQRGEYTQCDIESSELMGFVFVGAFADLTQQKQEEKNRIGFKSNDEENDQNADIITDEDYIEYGVVPELLGRIAVKCQTNQLTDDDYINIIKNPYSRVSTIKKTLKQYDIDLSDIMTDEEIKKFIQKSRDNHTGVRWVSAQVEGKMLECLRKFDIRHIVHQNN